MGQGHDPIERQRLVRAAVTPEEIGLCGCWQVIAVERLRQNLSKPTEEPSLEIGYYAASLAWDQYTDAEVLD